MAILLIVAVTLALIGFCSWRSNRAKHFMDVSMVPWNALMLILFIFLVLQLGYIFKLGF